MRQLSLSVSVFFLGTTAIAAAIGLSMASVVGVALVSVPPVQSRSLLDLLESLQQVCTTVARWAMQAFSFLCGVLR